MTRHPLDEYADRGQARGALDVYRAASSGPPLTTTHTPRRSRLGGAAILVAVLLVAGVAAVRFRSEDRTSRVESGVGPNPVSLDGVGLSVESSVVRLGDRLVVVDGMGGGAPHLRVWLAPAGDPAGAELFDHAEVGPLVDVTVGTLGDEAVLVGQQCPEPFDPAEHPDRDTGPRDALEECGVVEYDVYALDLVSGELRPLATELAPPGGEDGGLYLVASGQDEVLLEWRPLDQLVAIDTEGHMRTVSAPSGEGVGMDATSICAVNDSFVAVIPTGGEELEDLTNRPLGAYFTAERLVGDTWQPAAIPDTNVEPTFLDVVGCTPDGILMFVDHATTVDHGVQELVADGDGELAWRSLPLDDLQVGEQQIVDTKLVSGVPAIVISDRTHDTDSESSPPLHGLYGWDGTQWRHVIDQVGSGVDALIGDFEGSIDLEPTDDGTGATIQLQQQ